MTRLPLCEPEARDEDRQDAGAGWQGMAQAGRRGSDRDRALIATLTYSFAPSHIGAALKTKVEDLRSEGVGWELRLHEKGGKHRVMPYHHAMAEARRAYIDAAGLAEDRKATCSERRAAIVASNCPKNRWADLSGAKIGRSSGWTAFGPATATVTVFGAQERTATGAFVEILTGIRQHRLGFGDAAHRTGDRGFGNNFSLRHRRSRNRGSRDQRAGRPV
jgi:hypothetical protein